ncbi:LapA family protein [Mycobacterium sp.]|uniref:LapA family protein n=1 Tax=Mycobacterium sp. TaxID=1785 RepID=UPI003D0B6CC3
MVNTVIDHQHIAHPPTGRAVNTVAKRPVLLLVAMAIAAFVVCVASLVNRQIDLGVGAASVSLLAAGASLAWRSTEVRRVRQVQRDWTSAPGVAH